jgi:hypothetical protein
MGLLVLLACETHAIEEEICDWLRDELAGDWKLVDTKLSANAQVLPGLVEKQKDSGIPELFLVRGYPYVDSNEGHEEVGASHSGLANAFNVSRELIPRHRLHLIVFLSEAMQSLLALEAADFYHFADFSDVFDDDGALLGVNRLDDDDLLRRIEDMKRVERTIPESEVGGDLLFSLAKAFREFGDEKKSLACYQKSIEVFRESSDLTELRYCLTDFSFFAYAPVEMRKKALVEALALSGEAGHPSLDIYALESLAELHYLVGLVKESIYVLNVSALLSRKIIGANREEILLDKVWVMRSASLPEAERVVDELFAGTEKIAADTIQHIN